MEDKTLKNFTFTYLAKEIGVEEEPTRYESTFEAFTDLEARGKLDFYLRDHNLQLIDIELIDQEITTS